MKCPLCGATMRPGSTAVSRSTLGTITDAVVGTYGSSHYLYFHPDGTDESVCVDQSRPAFQCPGCAGLLVTGTKVKTAGQMKHPPSPRPESSPLKCPACGAAIGAEQERCPDCDIALR